jgi:hypothetical protein
METQSQETGIEISSRSLASIKEGMAQRALIAHGIDTMRDHRSAVEIAEHYGVMPTLDNDPTAVQAV